MGPQHLKLHYRLRVQLHRTVETTGEIAVLRKHPGRGEKPEIVLLSHIALYP